MFAEGIAIEAVVSDVYMSSSVIAYTLIAEVHVSSLISSVG